ncbi:MAG: hypothetical protein OET44_09205 [Gammaproteobacteria bacterium]|nr:hypothetical protein [Gammaproteobacteria bacterium]
MNKPLIIVCATLLPLLFAVPVRAAENFSVNADIGYVADDNVTKAEASDDIFEDSFITGSGGFTYKQELSFRSLLLYRGSVAFESYDEFDGLSNVALNGTIDYKIQLARGFGAAAYTLTAFVQEHDFESDMRDSTTLGVRGTVAKRFTDRIFSTFGLGYKKRESESDVFDTESARIFGNLDWLLTDQLVSYATLQYVVGDVVSTARPTLDIINAAQAIEPDDAFGGVQTGRFAYKLSADTALLTLGLNYGINRANSLDASVELLSSDADAIQYERAVIRLSYLVVF